MPSAIDVTKPGEGAAYTADVRANFATAAAEIGALQDSAGLEGDKTFEGNVNTDGWLQAGSLISFASSYVWIVSAGDVNNSSPNWSGLAIGIDTTDPNAYGTYLEFDVDNTPRWVIQVGVADTYDPAQDLLIGGFDNTGILQPRMTFRRATGAIVTPLFINAVDDAAAATAGVEIGQWYRSGSALHQRVA